MDCIKSIIVFKAIVNQLALPGLVSKVHIKVLYALRHFNNTGFRTYDYQVCNMLRYCQSSIGYNRYYAILEEFKQLGYIEGKTANWTVTQLGLNRLNELEEGLKRSRLRARSKDKILKPKKRYPKK